MYITPTVMRRLTREIVELKKNPPEGIRVATNDDDMLDLTGIIEGPEGTPYAGGYFKVRFKFTEEFPAAPPKCWFATKIFHPNVSSAGEICVNTLKKDWSPAYGVGHILVTVKCLLIYPNPESALDEEAGRLLLEDYESYCERARLITSVHAMPKVKPKEFDTPAQVSGKGEGPSKKAALAYALPTSTTAPTTTTSTTTSTRKPPSTQSQPLKPSASNTPALKDKDKDKDKDKEKDKERNGERHTSPAPLSTADANVGPNVKTAITVGAAGTGNKAVKRSAAATTGIEKRKKALKRL